MSNKGKRSSEEQIIRILKEIENSTSVAQVCRKYNVAETTVFVGDTLKHGIKCVYRSEIGPVDCLRIGPFASPIGLRC